MTQEPLGLKERRQSWTTPSNYHVQDIEQIMSDTRARARTFTLAPKQNIPWHHHSEVTDYYFVLRGRLTIKMRTSDKVCELQAGDRHQLEPGTPHLLCNRGAIDCKFLLLQGGGKYDWIKLDG